MSSLHNSGFPGAYPIEATRIGFELGRGEDRRLNNEYWDSVYQANVAHEVALFVPLVSAVREAIDGGARFRGGDPDGDIGGAVLGACGAFADTMTAAILAYSHGLGASMAAVDPDEADSLDGVIEIASPIWDNYSGTVGKLLPEPSEESGFPVLCVKRRDMMTLSAEVREQLMREADDAARLRLVDDLAVRSAMVMLAAATLARVTWQFHCVAAQELSGRTDCKMSEASLDDRVWAAVTGDLGRVVFDYDSGALHGKHAPRASGPDAAAVNDFLGSLGFAARTDEDEKGGEQ